MLVRTAGVAAIGLALVSCGGGEVSDEDAIRDVFRDFFAAFEDGDQEKLAGLLTGDCEGAEEIAADALQSYAERGLEDVTYDVTGADIRELTADSAEALPEGMARYPGGEDALADADSEYARFTKEDGEWKLADCNILFGRS